MKKILFAIMAVVALVVPIYAAPANALTDAVTDAVYVVENAWWHWDASTDYDTLVTTGADTLGGATKYFNPASGWEYYLLSGPASTAGQDSFALRLTSQAYDDDKRALDAWTTIDTIKTADTTGCNILLPWFRTQYGTQFRLQLQGVSGAGANDTAIINQRNFYIGRRQPALNTPAIGHSLPR